MTVLTYSIHRMRVSFYESASGRSPVVAYIDKLPSVRAEEVLAALVDIEEHGLPTPVQANALVTMRHIKGKLWELKVKMDRVFYVVITGPEMILLHAYKKQGQKAPPREIALAEKRMKQVL